MTEIDEQQPERDVQLDAAKRWVAEVRVAYADGGWAAGDGPSPPLDEMEWLIAEVERLRGRGARRG